MVATGGDAQPYIRAMEQFASPTGLLPEQVWDEPDKPEAHMFLGHATGSAMPLMWCHAEYVKLLRSVKDGRVFDLIPEVRRALPGRSSPRPQVENLVVSHSRRGHQVRPHAARDGGGRVPAALLAR